MVKGRLYGFGSIRPQRVSARVTRFHTHIGGRSTFLDAEEILGSTPYIHDCDIEMAGNHSFRRFKVYFTRHRLLPANSALLSVNATCPWHGELLVMKVAEDGGRHIHLETRSDVIMARKTVSRKAISCCICGIVLKLYPHTGSSTKCKTVPEFPVDYAFMCE